MTRIPSTNPSYAHSNIYVIDYWCPIRTSYGLGGTHSHFGVDSIHIMGNNWTSISKCKSGGQRYTI